MSCRRSSRSVTGSGRSTSADSTNSPGVPYGRVSCGYPPDKLDSEGYLWMCVTIGLPTHGFCELCWKRPDRVPLIGDVATEASTRRQD
jgi:hypothetical protein